MANIRDRFDYQKIIEVDGELLTVEDALINGFNEGNSFIRLSHAFEGVELTPNQVRGKLSRLFDSGDERFTRELKTSVTEITLARGQVAVVAPGGKITIEGDLRAPEPDDLLY